MVDLSKAAPVQKDRFFKLLDRHCACETVDFTVFDDQELKQRCRAIQIETLENKIALMPDKALSYFYLGDLYYANSMLDEAVANYSKSLLIKPDSAVVHFSLAIALNKQEKFNEAIKHFTEARRIRHDFAAMAHKYLGYALFRQGSLNESVSEYQKFLLVHPEDAHIHNDIGVVFAHWGKVDDAIRHFTEAVRIKPDFAPARKHLENALALRKKLYNNSAKFTDALQPDPNASRETIKL